VWRHYYTARPAAAFRSSGAVVLDREVAQDMAALAATLALNAMRFTGMHCSLDPSSWLLVFPPTTCLL
jgi:hypothetical protein